MKAGMHGAFVISWSQTDIDGLPAAAPDGLRVGATWSWQGQTVRVDGPHDVLRSKQSETDTMMRQRVARRVRKLVGTALKIPAGSAVGASLEQLSDSCFVITNGVQSYTVTIIDLGPGQAPLLMFVDSMPPRDQELWVVHAALDATRYGPGPERNGVICFTPGTRISTPRGPVPVDVLRQGDLVLTRDNGAQPVRWTGGRQMSGARLYVMPSLRPIRIRAGALGIERPEEELLVSPEHRMLLRGDHARALFNTPEVMVAARDLINGQTITVDHSVRAVTYIHLLLDAHQVLWANGVETESFHPASAVLDTLAEGDRGRLLAELPNLARDPMSYGGFVRRNLSASEAAIMLHDAA